MESNRLVDCNEEKQSLTQKEWLDVSERVLKIMTEEKDDVDLIYSVSHEDLMKCLA